MEAETGSENDFEKNKDNCQSICKRDDSAKREMLFNAHSIMNMFTLVWNLYRRENKGN